MAQHKVDPAVMASLWERVKASLEHPVHLFVNVGIKASKGKTKKETEREVWLEVVRAAFEEGARIGYDMGMTVAGASAPKEDSK